MRTNILLSMYEFGEDWAYSALKSVLRPEMRVTVAALSFNAGQTEEESFTEGHRLKFLPQLARYGIPPGQVELISWFRDTPETAKEKIRRSDVMLFTGGWPDHMMYRLNRWGLVEELNRFDGIVMGCSAGAMIQHDQFYLSPVPEEGYNEFQWVTGTGLIDKFYIEVHYRETPEQHAAIDRARREKGKAVVGIYNDGGLIVRGDQITAMGRVRLFLPEL